MWCRPWSFMGGRSPDVVACTTISGDSLWDNRGARSPAPVRLLPVPDRLDGDDPARVDRAVRQVVVAADVVEADGLGDAGRLIEGARVRPQVRVVDDPLQRALEVDVVDGVEAHERREQAPVGLDEPVAEQVA